MYGVHEQTDKKAMRYIDPHTRLTRREYIAMAEAINSSRTIRPYGDDWILSLGDENDRTNLEALATWVANQKELLVGVPKRQRISLLRDRFEKKMEHYYRRLIELGFTQW